MQTIIQKEFNNHIESAKLTLDNISDNIENAAKMCIECLNNGGKIVLFGNGGSAADAQHIAAELVGRKKSVICYCPYNRYFCHNMYWE